MDRSADIFWSEVDRLKKRRPSRVNTCESESDTRSKMMPDFAWKLVKMVDGCQNGVEASRDRVFKEIRARK